MASVLSLSEVAESSILCSTEDIFAILALSASSQASSATDFSPSAISILRRLWRHLAGWIVVAQPPVRLIRYRCHALLGLGHVLEIAAKDEEKRLAAEAECARYRSRRALY